ncbi:zinc finger protein 892-like [Salvelinus fontinalis]|uniref:zinc finger protein 892-like n=1 Tax=Salvelinus fontinalis TaxID=8038 RepID=UPI0024864CFB|nr:zinc finger protein 892-like [Salvelinus fontinalis]
MSFELAFGFRVASIMETLTEKAVQDICQLMGETYAALRVEMLHEQNQRSIKLQAIENNIENEKPANCMEIIQKPASPTGLRDFPVVEQILNEQEANGLWLEGDPTVEDEGPPSLVPEEEQPLQPFGQMTDMGAETWPAPPVIKQEEMDDGDMESQGYGKEIRDTHKANQNITGESDEPDRSPASGGSRELGLDDFKREQSPLLVSAEDAPAPTKKKCKKRFEKLPMANGIWQERDPTVEDKSPPSLVPVGEGQSQALSQTTDMGVETLPVPLVIKQEDDDMEFLGYGEWIPETHKANQNIGGESDEEERSPASGRSRELGLDDFKREQSPLLVSAEDAAAPTKKKCNNIKMYTCEVCGKIETKKGTMTSHMIKHTGLLFSCDICGEKFKCRDFLTRHKRSNHYTGIIYSCSVCGKTFRQATSRDTHERGHTGKNYWCSDCGETFKERQDRDTHDCIVYKGDRPFSCSECNEDFQRQYHLKQHQLEKHPLMVDQTVHYKLRCSVCGKVFTHIKWLIRHERTHRGKNERRDNDTHESFVEDPINKQLESKDLEGQFGSVESSEAPIRSEMIRYTCEICGKTWATKSGMRSHLVIHKKKHYTCDVCGKVFRLKSLFTMHQLRHTGFKSQYQLEKHPLKLEQPCSDHDTAMVVQGAQPSTDSDLKTDMSALGGSSSGPTD